VSGALPLANPVRWLQRTAWPVLPVAALIVAFGTAVQSSVAGPGGNVDGHLLRVAVGALAALVAVGFGIGRWRANAYLFYAVCVILLVGVLAAGRATNYAQRWIDLPMGFKLQPSEFLKIAVIVVLARWFSDRPVPERLADLLVPVALVVLPAVLVLGQPDLGTALSLGPLLYGFIYLSGARWGALRWLLVFPLLLAPLAAFGLHGYQFERVRTWWHQSDLTPEERIDTGYHLWHSKLAVGSGGLTGHGWGQGPENRLDRLPERHNDFIFPVMAEELGFLGAGAFLLGYATLPLLALLWSQRYRDPFARLVIGGVGLYYGTHLVINVGVALGIWPTTGLPLPLVSFGGSSMICGGLALGLAIGSGTMREGIFLSRTRRL